MVGFNDCCGCSRLWARPSQLRIKSKRARSGRTKEFDDCYCSSVGGGRWSGTHEMNTNKQNEKKTSRAKNQIALPLSRARAPQPALVLPPMYNDKEAGSSDEKGGQGAGACPKQKKGLDETVGGLPSGAQTSGPKRGESLRPAGGRRNWGDNIHYTTAERAAP